MSEKGKPHMVAVDLDAGLPGGPFHIGWLQRNQTTLYFEYTQTWLESRYFRPLDPMLGPYPGPQYPPRGRYGFGLTEDSSPDRWGRVLMQRREALSAEREQRPQRTLTDWDYLLGVQDQTRMGAVRLRCPENNRYIDDSDEPIPPMTELRTLEAAAIEMDSAYDRGDIAELDHWLCILVAPGSSLGGARPKCSFRATDGSLWIAKFPSNQDTRDVGLWEQVVTQLAARAGIQTADTRLARFGQRHHTFCIRRFDRTEQHRVPFISGMTATEKTDGEAASYLDLVQALDDHGNANVKQELAQLFRRVVFNILVANRDDHLRNHGFFIGPHGLRLAPAYDMNPAPEKPEHAISIDSQAATPDLSKAIATADLYGLAPEQTNRIITEVRQAVSIWRETAQAAGASRTEILLMQPAFDNS